MIGGGIIGVMTAWHLAERGLPVTLCEKGRIAGEQSSRNWGWIRQQGRDPAELPIMVESLRLWQSLAQEFGDALGFRQTGVMYLANTAKDIAAFEAWLPHARAHGVDSRMLTQAEVSAQLSGAQADWPGGLYTPSDARAEPWVAVPTLVAGAIRRGVTVIENCAVRALDRAAGRLTGVITEQGRIACDQVVLAGGAWSSLFARAEGVQPAAAFGAGLGRGDRTDGRRSTPARLRTTALPCAGARMAAIRWRRGPSMTSSSVPMRCATPRPICRY